MICCRSNGEACLAGALAVSALQPDTPRRQNDESFGWSPLPRLPVPKLSLSEWANLAEVVGAAAVVVSLLFVGVQVRDNTAEIRATNRQQLVGRAHEATRSFAVDPGLATILAKVESSESLSDAEAIQYGYLIRATLYDVQEGFVLNREGRLDDAYWATRAAVARAYLAQPLARQIYERDKAQGTLMPDFTDWVDQSVLP